MEKGRDSSSLLGKTLFWVGVGGAALTGCRGAPYEECLGMTKADNPEAFMADCLTRIGGGIDPVAKDKCNDALDGVRKVCRDVFSVTIE